MEGGNIVIKKATMIKKNTHDINQVYTVEKGVIRSIIIDVETW
jgi:hypothetical protein